MHIRLAPFAWAAVATAIIVAPSAKAVGEEPKCSPWEMHDDFWPLPSNSAAAAFDVARGVTVVCLPGDSRIWEWNGEAWSRTEPITTPGLDPEHLVLAYDSDRAQVVQHGGFQDFSYAYRTRSWTGDDWNDLTQITPVIFDHAAAYDAQRERLVIFGGRLPALSDDTWEFDGARWAQVATSGPSSRYGHAMAFDPVRNVTVLFGGFRSAFLGDTWEWDGVAWTQRSATGPTPRFRHAMAYSPEFGGVVLYGGDGQQGGLGLLDDLWLWDGETWTQLHQSTPPARLGHTMSHDAARGTLIVFGGQTSSEITSELWEVAPGGAAIRGRGEPGSLNNQPGAFDSARGRTVAPGDSRTTWEWNGVRWRAISASGPETTGGSAAFDSVRKVTVLYGGTFPNDQLDASVWEWGGVTWRRISPPQVRPAGGGLLVFDEARAEMMMVGAGPAGSDASRFYTWVWNGATWSLEDPVGIQPPWGFALAYDAARERVTLHSNGETWEWNGLTWAIVSTSGPPPRRYPLLAYDTVRERILLYGGYISPSSPKTDLWEWDGAEWLERDPPDGPLPRIGHLGAFDAIRGELVIHGGRQSLPFQLYTDTWTLTSLPLPPGDINGDAAVNMADLMLVVDRFNTQTKHPADLNRDGSVDFTDLNIVLAHFNQSCR